MIKLRRLNEKGLGEFQAFLRSLGSDQPHLSWLALLENPEYTNVIRPEVEVEARLFPSRYAMASYLHELLSRTRLLDLERDSGLWAWVALMYFEQLCPIGKSGKRKPGELARWILNPVGRRYYRHLVAGPYLVYRLHKDNPERAMAMLCGPPHQHSDVYLEIADSPEMVTNPAVVAAATYLYLDRGLQGLKRGTARDKPGGARRLGEVLAQFDCTWDLYSMSWRQIVDLLPDEFGRFKKTVDEALPAMLDGTSHALSEG